MRIAGLAIIESDMMSSIPGIGPTELGIFALMLPGILLLGLLVGFWKLLMMVLLANFGFRTQRKVSLNHLLNPAAPPCRRCGAAVTSTLPICTHCGSRICTTTKVHASPSTNLRR